MSPSPNHDHATNTARLPTPDKRNHPLFPLGHLVATAGVNAHLIDNGIDPTPFIRQHHCGLWGDVPPEDAQENDLSVLNGFRVLSSNSKQACWGILWLPEGTVKVATSSLQPIFQPAGGCTSSAFAVFCGRRWKRVQESKSRHVLHILKLIRVSSRAM